MCPDIWDLSSAICSSKSWVAIIPNTGPQPRSVKATLHITWPENGMTDSSSENLHWLFSHFEIKAALKVQIVFEGKASRGLKAERTL